MRKKLLALLLPAALLTGTTAVLLTSPGLTFAAPDAGWQRMEGTPWLPVEQLIAFDENNILAADRSVSKWDGAKWTAEPLPELDSAVSGLAARGPSDVWAVGQSASAHFNGRGWTRYDYDRTGQFQQAMHAVAPLSASRAMAVGWYQDNIKLPGDGRRIPAVQLWNGTGWTQATVPDLGLPRGADAALLGVAGTGQNEAWVVGGSWWAEHDGDALLLYYDGQSWRRIQVGFAATLNAVTAFAPDDVWVGGFSVRDGTQIPVAAHWDGTRWTPTETVDVPESGFKSFTRTASGEVLAVTGDYLIDPWRKSGGHTELLAWKDNRWQRQAKPASRGLNAITAVPGSDTLIVGGRDADDQPAAWSLGAGHRESPPFAGEQLKISYDNGFEFSLKFTGADRMHWTVLAGQDPAEGDERIVHRKLADQVYELRWVERDGTSVRQVQNWKNRTVTAEITLPEPQTLRLHGTFSVLG
ncbi:hypothetical protein D5S17_19975 [Pseudonocardiaceae bacterium YIM PH 21723]|nr:hypothetical protein D5S17_19975 [Pseudonocardiaceae bacterium YIM PH 21723]